jgi:hypothetical protein
MDKDEPRLSTKRPPTNGQYVQVTNDQIAFPRKPRGAVPDGEHLSAREWAFMVLLGRWCYRGKPCTQDNLELADAMGITGTEQARKDHIKILLNGRWNHGIRWPGLCDPSRGFIIRKYARGGRNDRQLYTTKKWEQFSRAMRLFVPAPTAENEPLGPQDDPQPPELHPVIIEAAAIAEKHILPLLVGQAVAEMIRGDHRWSRLLGERLETLPGAVWMAAKRKPANPFAWIRKVSINGYNTVEAEADQAAVLKRDEARPGPSRAPEEPTPPPTAEELAALQRQYPSLAMAMARLKNPPL